MFVIIISSHGESFSDGFETTINSGNEYCSLGPYFDLTDNELFSYLKDMDADKLVIIDACHSGGFWGNMNPEDAGDLEKVKKPLAFIASVRENENAFYASTGLGILQYALVEGLTRNIITRHANADHNFDGIVTFEELAVYVSLIDFLPYYQVVYEKAFGDPVTFTQDSWNPVGYKNGDISGLGIVRSNNISPIINMLLYD